MWKLSIEKACQQQGSDPLHGLNWQEVNSRKTIFGLNKLPESKPPSPLYLLLSQFSSIIIWVLIGACLVAAMLGEWIDATAIASIIVLNAILGFIQEWRAERSLAALRNLSSPTAKVIRAGIMEEIPAQELVPGDLVYIESGDRIPADGRLVATVRLSVQEASLTGESIPVYKDTEVLPASELEIGDRKNMLFMGTVAVSGKGHLLVTATGKETELGQIATLLEHTVIEITPLQHRLTRLGKRLVGIFLAIVIGIFLFGVLRGNSVFDMLLTSLSLAVAAIPEGLPAVVTIALAYGVHKMVRRHSLIRRLASVETLGSTTVICTDKTGTLTQNNMVVREVWVNGNVYNVTGVGYIPIGDFKYGSKKIAPNSIPELFLALKIGTLCNNASLFKKEHSWHISGDPTEAALLVASEKAGLIRPELEDKNPLLDEIPFDSERKWMTMTRQTEQGRVSFIKGAPDVLLEKAENILIDGEERPLNEELKATYLQANNTMAKQALRVLALAYTAETIDKGITLVGLIGMIDPPRAEVKKAIATCKKAGIRTVMITGDHKATALAIAKDLNMWSEGDKVIDGKELDQISDDMLAEIVDEIVVYARTSAQHKIRIIRAWKKKGEIVAMTGDGVNDAPAIKEADIGIAMGITGTDVTKEASDMVITDDNFASIVAAVEEGRGIYTNIMKFVRYLLTSNFAEILVIFLGMVIGFTDAQGKPFLTLLPIHLLWINLVTDGLPAVALGMDPVDPDAMNRQPRPPKSRILPMNALLQYALISFFMAAGVLILCYWGLKQSAELGRTLAFTTLVVLELVKVQIVRAPYHISLFSNPILIAALVSSIVMQLAVIYIPFLQPVFSTIALGLTEWGLMAITAIMVWIIATVIMRLKPIL